MAYMRHCVCRYSDDAEWERPCEMHAALFWDRSRKVYGAFATIGRTTWLDDRDQRMGWVFEIAPADGGVPIYTWHVSAAVEYADTGHVKEADWLIPTGAIRVASLDSP